MNGYHSVAITFNWWMLIATLNFVIMFVVGGQQYMLKNLKIKPRFGEDVFVKTAFILTVFTAIMFAVESSRGLLQIVINLLDDKHSKCAEGLSVIVFLFAFAIYGCLLYFVSTAAVVRKIGKIREERKRIIGQRHRRERRMKQNDDNMDPWVY